MNYKLVKEEFIKLKKEELAYIDSIADISSKKILMEEEKLNVHRTLKVYEKKITEMSKKLFEEIRKEKELESENLKDILIEFDIDKNFLSSLKFKYEYSKKNILENLGIDINNFKFKLTLYDLLYHSCDGYREIDSDEIQNNQKLFEKSIYIFCGYYDTREDCYGPYLGDHDNYLLGIYENICQKYNNIKEIQEKFMKEFEEDNTVIHSEKYVRSSFEITEIFKEELLNIKNKTINDCIIKTENRIKKLSYTRSPEYKEKVLLEKINEFYKKIKGEYIKKETLYSGEFIEIFRNTYKLPNENIIQKETIVKNEGKNKILVIGITADEKYIVTCQHKTNNEIIAEFPSEYIEFHEDIIEATKRILKTKLDYNSNDLFIIDEVYAAPENDNSITYIVIANNCIKTDKKDIKSINYELFSEKELNYLINNNLMNGAIDKLAYYNLINNTETRHIGSVNSNLKTYKIKIKKTNQL